MHGARMLSDWEWQERNKRGLLVCQEMHMCMHMCTHGSEMQFSCGVECCAENTNLHREQEASTQWHPLEKDII